MLINAIFNRQTCTTQLLVGKLRTIQLEVYTCIFELPQLVYSNTIAFMELRFGMKVAERVKFIHHFM